MKKNLIKMMLAAIVVASGVNIYNSQKESGISDVVLANVEALAREEWYDGVYYWDKLYNKCVEDGQTKIPCPCGALG